MWGDPHRKLGRGLQPRGGEETVPERPTPTSAAPPCPGRAHTLARLPRLTPPRRAEARPGPSLASCSADARGRSKLTRGGERRAPSRSAPSFPLRREQCLAPQGPSEDQRPVRLTAQRHRLIRVPQPRFPGRNKRHRQRCRDLRHLASDGGAAGTRFLS